jgi:NAD(P)H-hydrate repair Nnr-like enzyme with NAD(P)H-hydrate dehydratase domain
MKNAIAGLVTAFSMSALAAATPARAGSGDVAAGLIGGFAAGAIVGSALAPRPAPVYFAPAPVYVEPACYWTRGRPMWDGYRWVRPRIQVCD